MLSEEHQKRKERGRGGRGALGEVGGVERGWDSECSAGLRPVSRAFDLFGQPARPAWLSAGWGFRAPSPRPGGLTLASQRSESGPATVPPGLVPRLQPTSLCALRAAAAGSAPGARHLFLLLLSAPCSSLGIHHKPRV